MTIQTAIWIPPSLCGCQLQITGDFANVVNGVTYQHPTPYTITDIEIVNVCAGHKTQTLSMPDTSIYFSDATADPSTLIGYLASKNTNITPSAKQVRGYLTYPIANPTSAHNLYTFFSNHGGQKESYPCGCSLHRHIDNNGIATIIPNHPLNTNQCEYHVGDTADMQQAKTDFTAYQASVATIEAEAPPNSLAPSVG